MASTTFKSLSYPGSAANAMPFLSGTSLNCAQDLMVLRCIRPDRGVPAVLEFVAGKLGEKFVNPPPFDLAGSYADSNVARLPCGSAVGSPKCQEATHLPRPCRH